MNEMNIYLVTTSCKPGADSFNRIYLFNIRLCCCTDSVAHMVLGLVTRTEQESCEICHKYQFGFLIMQCSHMIILQQLQLIFPWPSSRECIPQQPGPNEYYNQLFCLLGHLGGVSEIQTSLDVSDL